MLFQSAALCSDCWQRHLYCLGVSHILPIRNDAGLPFGAIHHVEIEPHADTHSLTMNGINDEAALDHEPRLALAHALHPWARAITSFTSSIQPG